MRALAGQGRWVWGLSGLVTAAALAVPGALLITSPGTPDNADAQPQHVVTRTETVPQPVTSLLVQSYGGQVKVTSGQVNRVQVIEKIGYDQGIDSPPVVTQSVSGGRLSLFDPACSNSDCNVDFDVTVPGGPYAVTADSGGGPESLDIATDPAARPTLTVSSGGGPLRIEPAPRPR